MKREIHEIDLRLTTKFSTLHHMLTRSRPTMQHACRMCANPPAYITGLPTPIILSEVTLSSHNTVPEYRRVS
jgi:hypothetical protein